MIAHTVLRRFPSPLSQAGKSACWTEIIYLLDRKNFLLCSPRKTGFNMMKDLRF